MTLKEVKTGLLTLMQTKYPDYKYYSMAVVEDFDRPSFFTQIKPVDTTPINYNSRMSIYAFYITVFQEEVDEVALLDVIDTLRDLFELSVRIKSAEGNRSVDVNDFEFDFVGTDRNVAQIIVTLQWQDRIDHTNNAPLMESVEFNQTMEE